MIAKMVAVPIKQSTPKTLYFLSGLPRSGSTLLAALLSQNPNVYVSPTSALIAAMQGATMGFLQDRSTTASPVDGQLAHVLRGAADGMYAHVKESNVIDKNRGWPAHIDKLREILGEDPKIVCTVRPIAECIASFIKLQKPENVRQYVRNIMDQNGGMVMGSYVALKYGFENYRKNLLFVEYDDLINNPKHELGRIYDFLGIEGHDHDFNDIINPIIENDTDAWGIPGLHTIRKKLEKRHYDPEELLGKDLWETYQGGEFWNDKPEPVREKKPLDFMLEAGLRGDFDKGWEIVQQADPEDNRAMFNKGWHLLSHGKLIEGMEHMDKGRLEDVFGNRHIGTPLPLWDGISKGTVLLNCEGGLGDQICNIRFAKDIAERGCKVVASCSPELMPILKDVEGVSSVISHGTNPLNVYHDFWTPSMSAVHVLKYEYEDLSGKSYIKKPDVFKEDGKKLKVGLRWYGNPRFEHEQHRKFPPELMFSLLDNIDCEFYSLQRDDGVELKPDEVEQLKLDTWADTMKSLAGLDLVITSCTAVAHLSAAMGIPTWNIVPILPYYLWALPGDTTPYYDSMRIFRQEKYEEWSAPFDKTKEELKKKLAQKLTKRTTRNSTYYPEVFSVQNLEQAKKVVLTDENNENKWDIETKLSVEKLIRAFFVTKDSVLLDYGCGIGRIAKELIRQTNCTVVGVDSSSSMLKLSDDYVDSKNFKSYSIDDLKKLIDTGLKFDAAFSILVLQHSLNPQQDINLIYSALRDEGLFYLLNENKRFLPTRNSDSKFVNWKDDGKDIVKLTEEKFTEIEDSSYKNLASKLYKKKDDDEPKRRAFESSMKRYLLSGEKLRQEGHDLQAADVFRKVIEIAPDYSEVYGLLGDSLISIGDYSEAEKVLLKAIELNPNYAIAMGNLGNSYVVRGRNAEAEKWYKKAVELMPENNNNHSNLMLCLNYGGHSKKEIYEEHNKWEDMHARSLECIIEHENTRDPNKRLRVGYVSPDFRLHSVNYFFEPLLEAHDKNKIETFCYAEVDKPDDVTKRLQELADNWVSTVGMSDEDVSEKIRADGIDILVDLAGHTKGNRLLVFARKPAPVQVSWMGYANTTGVNAIDYRVTDAIADPEGLTDDYYSEKLVRLPKSFLCFKPNESSPDVSLSPCKKNGYITFGSLSDSAKVLPEVVKTWSAILRNVQSSCLFLKSRALAENATRRRYLDMFEKFGVNRGRIKFSGLVQSSIEHLDTYKNIDISLDTFPYSGTATTSESLWMGVPIITLAGDRFAGRTGTSILTQVGLEDLITENKEDYVKTAIMLAGDLGRLDYLRSGLRTQIKESQFYNKKEFAHQFETAYRDMWKRWCD